MGARFMFQAASGIVRSRGLWALVICLQALMLAAALGGIFGMRLLEEAELASMRAVASAESTFPAPGNGAEESPLAVFHRDREERRNVLVDELIAAYETDDLAAYFDAKADLLQFDYDAAGGVDQAGTPLRIALYRALSERHDTSLPSLTAELPALHWLALEEQGSLEPVASFLPFLTSADASEGGARIYNPLPGDVLWVAPIIVVAGVAASRLRRGRLADLAPMRPITRFLISSATAAVCGAGAVALTCLPAAGMLLIRNGLGDSAFPIVTGTDLQPVVATVGAVLAERAVIVLLMAVVCSLAIHIAVASCDRVWPGAAVLAVGALGTVSFPGYFGRFSSFRGVAEYLPNTYLNLGYVTGGVTAVPEVRPLPRITFESGLWTLAVTVVALAGLLCACALVFRASGVRRMNGADGNPGGPSGHSTSRGHSMDAGLSAKCDAAPTPMGARSGSEVHDGDRLGASRAPAGSRFLPACRYFLHLLRLLSASPAYLASAALLIVVAVAPTIFSIDPDLRVYAPSVYRDGALRELDAIASSSVEGAREHEVARGLRDTLSSFVYAPTPVDQHRALAAYERLRLDSAASGEISLDPGEDPMEIEARALFLEHLADAADPVIYPIGRKMPAFVYLTQLLSVVPGPFWLLPAAVLAMTAADADCKGSVVRQAPLSRAAALLTGAAVVALLALAALLAAAASGFAIAAARNGVGDAGYPIASVLLGRPRVLVATDVIAGFILLAATASAGLATAVMVVARLSGHFRTACACLTAIGLLGITASACSSALATAPAGPTSRILSALPFSYLDISAAAGAFGYAPGPAPGAGVAFGAASWLALAVSFPLLVPLLVRRFKALRGKEGPC